MVGMSRVMKKTWVRCDCIGDGYAMARLMSLVGWLPLYMKLVTLIFLGRISDCFLLVWPLIAMSLSAVSCPSLWFGCVSVPVTLHWLYPSCCQIRRQWKQRHFPALIIFQILLTTLLTTAISWIQIVFPNTMIAQSFSGKFRWKVCNYSVSLGNCLCFKRHIMPFKEGEGPVSLSVSG